MSETREPARDPLPYRVIVFRDGIETDVTDALADVYDIAINCMDFGSGFLSTEEVGNLRALGAAIGAERFDYQHDKCMRCGHDYERHYTYGCGPCGDSYLPGPSTCSIDKYVSPVNPATETDR